MPKPTYIGAALSIALFALAAGGCGGNSDSTAAAPTKAAFIKQADAICAKADKEQEASLRSYAKTHPLGELSAGKQLEAAVRLGLPPLKQEATELGELTPPTGNEKQVERVVKEIEGALTKAESDPKLLVSSNTTPFNKPDKIAKEYGFHACSDSS